MEVPKMDKTHPCLICKEPVDDGKGIACPKHQEEAANKIAEFNTIMDAGVPLGSNELPETFT